MKKKTMIIISSIVGVILLLIFAKAIHTSSMMKHIGSFETEKADLLQRRDWLLSKVVTTPEKLINEMPGAVGPIIKGEWALYSCSMLSSALVNLANIYPETRDEAVSSVYELIKIALDEKIRDYDSVCWGEDPLVSIDGENSHVSYISILAWMIGGYKSIGGDDCFDALQDRLCATLSRRFLLSPHGNLSTYPDGIIYVPDELVGIAALAIYARQHGGTYQSTVDGWLDNILRNWTDATGMIASYFPDVERMQGDFCMLLGSYSSLICYYMTFVDEDYARDLYLVLKDVFLQRKPFCGIKEYWSHSCLLGFDIDAGPIIFNLSPSGTAFAIGPATYFGDTKIRNRFLRTAEIAGTTVVRKGKRHYRLADIALVGEAITLAMRTAVSWE